MMWCGDEAGGGDDGKSIKQPGDVGSLQQQQLDETGMVKGSCCV